jgi:hypothetical protein
MRIWQFQRQRCLSTPQALEDEWQGKHKVRQSKDKVGYDQPIFCAIICVAVGGKHDKKQQNLRLRSQQRANERAQGPGDWLAGRELAAPMTRREENRANTGIRKESVQGEREGEESRKGERKRSGRKARFKVIKKRYAVPVSERRTHARHAGQTNRECSTRFRKWNFTIQVTFKPLCLRAQGSIQRVGVRRGRQADDIVLVTHHV